jgi:hypothetical protein
VDEYILRQRESALRDLQYHWGDAYKITYVNGMLRAERRDNGAAVSAPAAAALRQLLIDDYSAAPVPREVQEGKG